MANGWHYLRYLEVWKKDTRDGGGVFMDNRFYYTPLHLEPLHVSIQIHPSIQNPYSFQKINFSFPGKMGGVLSVLSGSLFDLVRLENWRIGDLGNVLGVFIVG